MVRVTSSSCSHGPLGKVHIYIIEGEGLLIGSVLVLLFFGGGPGGGGWWFIFISGVSNSPGASLTS